MNTNQKPATSAQTAPEPKYRVYCEFQIAGKNYKHGDVYQGASSVQIEEFENLGLVRRIEND